MRQTNYYMADDNRLIRVSIIDGAIDEVAELECLSIVEEADEEEEEAEEEVEEAKPTKKKEQKGKQWDVKPCCGSAGPRHKKDCPSNKQVDKNEEPEEEKEDGEAPYMMSHGVLSTHQEKVSAMWDAGKSEEQIYNAMYQHMTTEEFRKAMDHAKL